MKRIGIVLALTTLTLQAAQRQQQEQAEQARLDMREEIDTAILGLEQAKGRFLQLPPDLRARPEVQRIRNDINEAIIRISRAIRVERAQSDMAVEELELLRTENQNLRQRIATLEEDLRTAQQQRPQEAPVQQQQQAPQQQATNQAATQTNTTTQNQATATNNQTAQQTTAGQQQQQRQEQKEAAAEVKQEQKSGAAANPNKDASTQQQTGTFENVKKNAGPIAAAGAAIFAAYALYKGRTPARMRW